MADAVLHFADAARGDPFHAALAPLGVGDHGSELHGHADFYELMGVFAGRGQHRLANGVQQLEAGDVVLVRPTDRHAFRALPPQGLHFVNVAFPARRWRDFVAAVPVRQARRWESGALPPVWRLTGDRRLRAEETFRRALARSHRGPTHLDLARFWLETLEAVLDADPPSQEVQRPEWLVRACVALREEPNLQAGLPRFVELASVSPAHLSRTVRQHYGTTPTELVMRVRLEHAAALLTTTSEPVTEIAARSGFDSPSYFSRCFHARHGLSPRAFRERTRRAVVP